MSLPDWARAHGAPLFAAVIRFRADDFEVTERLGWDCSGEGEHDYLWIQKTGANTEWLARQLARHANVPAKDVGYAGLKDRRAVTRQWFSVPRWNSPDWSALDVEGVAVLDVRRHHKKLRRGAHRGNAFRITLRGDDLARYAGALEERIQRIAEQGVPNYFGEQRFGRDGSNLRLANQWAEGKKMPRHSRSLAISTIRSFLFNEALDERVREGTWNRLVAGDMANLDGSRSVFDVETVDDELRGRCDTLDVHPIGVLSGKGSGLGPDGWRAALDRAGIEPGTRPLRIRVAQLDCNIADGIITLMFDLGRGAFATSVLREICTT